MLTVVDWVEAKIGGRSSGGQAARYESANGSVAKNLRQGHRYDEDKESPHCEGAYNHPRRELWYIW